MSADKTTGETNPSDIKETNMWSLDQSTNVDTKTLQTPKVQVEKVIAWGRGEKINSGPTFGDELRPKTIRMV